MSKPIIPDIRPPEKRSIRVIPLPNQSESHEPISTTLVHDQIYHAEHPGHTKVREEEERKYIEYNDSGDHRRRRLILWGAVVVCALVLFLVVANVFAGATVVVAPRTEEVKTDFTLSASKSGATTDLAYQLITLSEQQTKEVPASGEKMVAQKASGKIVIYNNNSTQSQKLVVNTRFETPEGLIYRIAQSITIPGKVGNVPGSLEVTVFGDEVGPKYNIGLTDFTIPGFKTSPDKYKNIYARSKTTMTGGAQGLMKIVKATDAKIARDAMNADLKSRLLASAKSQTPDGYAFFEGTAVLNFEQLPDQAAEATDASVKISQKATLTAPLISREILAQAIAREMVAGYADEAVAIPDLSKITVTLRDSAVGVLEKDPVFLTLRGGGSLVWGYDSTKLAEALKSQKTSQFSQILKAFPEVAPVKAVVRPFWKTSFPSEIGKIKVVENK